MADPKAAQLVDLKVEHWVVQYADLKVVQLAGPMGARMAVHLVDQVAVQ